MDPFPTLIWETGIVCCKTSPVSKSEAGDDNEVTKMIEEEVVLPKKIPAIDLHHEDPIPSTALSKAI